MDTVIDPLEGLDWKAGEPCQGYGHYDVHVPKGDARWLQRGRCPRCSIAHELKVCEGGRQYRYVCDQITCTACGQKSPTGEWGLRFDRLGGAR